MKKGSGTVCFGSCVHFGLYVLGNDKRWKGENKRAQIVYVWSQSLDLDFRALQLKEWSLNWEQASAVAVECRRSGPSPDLLS